MDCFLFPVFRFRVRFRFRSLATLSSTDVALSSLPSEFRLRCLRRLGLRLSTNLDWLAAPLLWFFLAACFKIEWRPSSVVVFLCCFLFRAFLSDLRRLLSLFCWSTNNRYFHCTRQKTQLNSMLYAIFVNLCHTHT